MAFVTLDKINNKITCLKRAASSLKCSSGRRRPEIVERELSAGNRLPDPEVVEAMSGRLHQALIPLAQCSQFGKPKSQARMGAQKDNFFYCSQLKK